MTSNSGSNLYSQSFGTTPSNVPFITTRDPGPTDVRGPNGPFKLGQRWINSTENSSYTLTSFSTTAGLITANWLGEGGGGDGIQTINTIFPDGGGDFTIAAGSDITITPGTNEITIGLTDGSVIKSLNVQTFTANGTYTPTSGMAYCIIQCLGGGGAGAGAEVTGVNEISLGSGGGAGAYAMGLFTSADIGVSQAVTIAAGGTPATGLNGGDGGITSVGALISVGGGGGGVVAGSATPITTAVGGGEGSGGAGGDVRSNGQAGSPAYGIYVGALSISMSGAGGSSQFGAGGPPIFNGSNEDGNSGSGYGSGGSGASNQPSQAVTMEGGAGASGIVIITEYIA